MKRPTLGWRTPAKIIREWHQGGLAARWSPRRLLFLLAEYRLNCRRELVLELHKSEHLNKHFYAENALALDGQEEGTKGCLPQHPPTDQAELEQVEGDLPPL